MAISYIGFAGGGTTTTTSFALTMPTTQAGDLLIVEYTHRGTGDGTFYSSTGTPWTKAHSQTYNTSFSGKTFWTIATGNHAGQIVTVTGLTNSCAAILTHYRGTRVINPLSDATIVGEANASGNETQAQITTATNGAWVVLVVANSPDLAVATQSSTSPGTLTERAEVLSTGGTDTSIAHASAVKATAGATGSLTWTQTNAASGSWAYAINPDALTVTPNTADATDFGSDTTPTVEFTGTDYVGHDLTYQAQILDDNTAGTAAASYSSTNYDAPVSMWVHRVGQSFTSTSTPQMLDSASFYLKKVGTPPGNVRAQLYAHSGTYGTSSVGTGSPLATSDAIAASTLTTSFQTITFNFTGAERYALAASTNYVIVIEYTAGTEAVHEVQIGLDVSSPSHGGNTIVEALGTWTPYSVYDTVFAVYGANDILLDKVSSADSGFANTVSGGDTDPFTQNNKVSFTVQAGDALATGTYYWRARCKDPSGSNTWTPWTTARSFTVTVASGSVAEVSGAATAAAFSGSAAQTSSTATASARSGSTAQSSGAAAASALVGSKGVSTSSGAGYGYSASFAQAVAGSTAAALAGSAAAAAGAGTVAAISGAIASAAGVATATAVPPAPAGIGEASGVATATALAGSIGAAAGVASAAGTVAMVGTAAGLATTAGRSGSVGASSGVATAAAVVRMVGVAAGAATIDGRTGSRGQVAGVATAAAVVRMVGVAAGVAAATARSGSTGAAAGVASAAAIVRMVGVAAGLGAADARSGSVGQAAGASTAAAVADLPDNYGSSAGSSTASALSGATAAAAGVGTATGTFVVIGQAVGAGVVVGASGAIANAAGVAAAAGVVRMAGAAAGAASVAGRSGSKAEAAGVGAASGRLVAVMAATGVATAAALRGSAAQASGVATAASSARVVGSSAGVATVAGRAGSTAATAGVASANARTVSIGTATGATATASARSGSTASSAGVATGNARTVSIALAAGTSTVLGLSGNSAQASASSAATAAAVAGFVAQAAGAGAAQAVGLTTNAAIGAAAAAATAAAHAGSAAQAAGTTAVDARAGSVAQAAGAATAGAQASVYVQASASLVGTASLNASAGMLYQGASALAGSGAFTADATHLVPADRVRPGTGDGSSIYGRLHADSWVPMVEAAPRKRKTTEDFWIGSEIKLPTAPPAAASRDTTPLRFTGKAGRGGQPGDTEGDELAAPAATAESVVIARQRRNAQAIAMLLTMIDD